MSLRKAVLSFSVRKFSTAIPSHKTVREVFEATNTQPALDLFFKKPSVFGATFLISKPEISLDDCIKIHETVKESKGAISATLHLVGACKRRKKTEMMITLLDNIIEQVDSMNVQQLKSIDGYSWNSLLFFLLTHPNYAEKGINYFQMLLSEKVTTPNEANFTTALTLCAKDKKLSTAIALFSGMKQTSQTPNVIHYNNLMKCFINCDNLVAAMNLLQDMEQISIKPTATTFTILLKGCAIAHSLENGQKLHHIINSLGIEVDEFVGNSLVNMFSECGDLPNSLAVFESMKKANRANLITYNSVVKAFVISNKLTEAWNFLDEFRKVKLVPDAVTYITLLKGCTEEMDLRKGEVIHSVVQNRGLLNDIALFTALMNMYAKCGKPKTSISLFEKYLKSNQANITIWTVYIQSLIADNQMEKVFQALNDMKTHDIKPNNVTHIALITACTEKLDLELGKNIHDMIEEKELLNDIALCTALMNMYSKCGKPKTSISLFEKYLKSNRANITMWTVYIQSLIADNQMEKVFQALNDMKTHEIKPNSITYIELLSGCAEMGSLDYGKTIHSMIEQSFVDDINLNNTLITMYSKCGDWSTAKHIFENVISNHPHDVITWNAMIACYARHGKSDLAISLFNEMQVRGVAPNAETFVSLFTACSHNGLLKEAVVLYERMQKEFNIPSNTMHKSCIVDLLSRFGKIEEAELLVGSECKDAIFWMTLLGACRKFNNVEKGEQYFGKIMEIDDSNASAYVLMANIYAQAGLVQQSDEVRELMKKKGVKKIPGMTFIEINGKIHYFTSEDKTHPEKEKIYAEVFKLRREMKEAGYKPDISWVLRQGTVEEKEDLLCLHSEKLAMAYAFISLPPGSTIRISKNLRVCGDCHEATKIISKIRKCEIIVRDASRFHHFKDGRCDCGDYF